jgi:hypothetical protein
MRSSQTWYAKRTERALAALLLLGSLGGGSARAGDSASFAQRAQASRSEPKASEAHQVGERRPSEWTAFAPDGGRFAVELPGAPAVEGDSHWTPVGSIAMTKYWLRAGDALLAVEVHDIPAVAAALVSDDRVLDEARDSLIRDMGGTLIEGRALALSGAPARDFRYRLPGKAKLEERVLAVLLDTRLFIVTGMARSPASDPEVGRFFASFRFWSEGQAPAAAGSVR